MLKLGVDSIHVKLKEIWSYKVTNNHPYIQAYVFIVLIRSKISKVVVDKIITSLDVFPLCMTKAEYFFP